MNFGNPLVLLGLGFLIAIAGYWIATHYFSEEAKAERRRRRSNAPIKSDAKRPMVKFSVKTPKKKG